MGNWKIVTPRATTNLCTNPTFYDNTTGWTSGNTIVQDTGYRLVGLRGLKVTIGGSPNLASYAITFPSAGTYFVSGYFKAIDGVLNGTASISISGFTSATTDVSREASTTVSDGWVRLWAIVTIDAGDLTGNVSFDLSTIIGNTGFTYALDAVMISESGQPEVYVDGEQDGCRWLGERYASQSMRRADAYGGQEWDLEADLGVYVNQMSGFGSPRIDHATTARVSVPGSRYQAHRYQESNFQLFCTLTGSSQRNYHQIRNDLLDKLTPDHSHGSSVWVVYTGADVPKKIRAVYRGGLEGEKGVTFGEEFAISFTAFQVPTWQGPGLKANDNSDYLTTTIRSILMREERQYNDFSLSAFTTTGVKAFDKNLDTGEVLIAGKFTDFDGVAASDYLVRYDPVAGTFTNLGTLTLGGSADIYDVLYYPPHKDIYICGNFTDADGDTTADFIARYDTSVGIWEDAETPLNTGTITSMNTMCLLQDGHIAVGGDFTNIEGASLPYLARLDPEVNWGHMDNVDQDTPNDVVHHIVNGPGGRVYVAGEFTQIGSNTNCKRVAMWDPTTGWQAMGGGLGSGTQAVKRLLVAPDGHVYAGGDFTVLGDGTTTCRRLARWDGQSWEEVGGGITSASTEVKALAWYEGKLWIGGDFDEVEGVAWKANLAVYDSGRFFPSDLVTSSATWQWNTLEVIDDQLWMGAETQENVTIPGVTTHTYEGNARTWPILDLQMVAWTETTRLVRMENVNTGAVLYFDLDLIGEEIVKVDLRPGRRSVRSDSFEYKRAFLPGSDLGNFYLEPGDNIISVLVDPEGGTGVAHVMLVFDDMFMGAD